ncbi:MAG: MOSC domain-containing protein [Blastocatellia bacterium]
MMEVRFLTKEELEVGLPAIRQSPKDEGELQLIVRRPAVDARELLTQAELDTVVGLVGDTWKERRSSRTEDGSPHPDMQLNIINTRAIALISPDETRQPLAGDQLFLDLDLSKENLPAGTRLALGTAVIEVTAQPHTGCKKFVERFGVEAMKFVNSPVGRELCLRGINARVLQSGVIRVGDRAKKL